MFRLLRGSIALVLLLGFSSGALVVGVEAMGSVPRSWTMAQSFAHEWGEDIVVDSAGNSYITGTSVAVDGFNNNYLTVKYDPDGNLLWVAIYDGPGNGSDHAFSIAIDSAGNVYVTGQSWGGTSWNSATVKYDSSGTEQWVARCTGPSNLSVGRGIAVDLAGNVYVAAYGDGAGTSYDYLTLKYDTYGQQLWEARYNGPFNQSDIPSKIALDSAGNVYVTGYSWVASTTTANVDYATVKYDTDGNQQWVAMYDGPGTGAHADYDIPCALAVDSAGNVYVTGQSCGSTTGWSYDYATVAYNGTTGDPLWDFGGGEIAARYNGPDNSYDYGLAIAVDLAGNVYVTGQSWGEGTQDDYVTIKYNSGGVEQWINRYNGPGNGTDSPCDMALDLAGNVYVVGESEGNGTDTDIATVAYNGTTGTPLWDFGGGEIAARYNGAENSYDFGYAIAVDPAGYVYITGGSDGGMTYCDAITIKYDYSSGSPIWVRRYDFSNQPPTADAGPDQTATDNTLPLGTEQVTLNGSGSTDPDGASDIASYIWKENNVQIASGVLPTVSLSVATHTIVLTVTDQAGESSTDTVVITVNPTNVPAMVQNIADDVAQVETENQAGLTGLLDAASKAYAGKKYSAAINMMKAFINLCNADSLLSDTDRNRLIAKANNVIAIIQALHL